MFDFTEKKDEDDAWTLLASKLDSDREASSCRDRLKTLLSSYKKLRSSQMSETGNKKLSLPAYWDKLCLYLTPYAGMRGEWTTDSGAQETSAQQIAASFVEDNKLRKEEAERKKKEEAERKRKEKENNNEGLFSPNNKRQKTSGPTKKSADLTAACDLMSKLADHIMTKGKPEEPNVKEQVEEISSRVQAMENKMDNILQLLLNKQNV